MMSSISSLDSAWACRKLWRRPHDELDRSTILRFVRCRQAETDRQQLVLRAHRPGAREAESFSQPQHSFEPPDRPSCRVEVLKAANPRHGSLDPEMIALD